MEPIETRNKSARHERAILAWRPPAISRNSREDLDKSLRGTAAFYRRLVREENTISRRHVNVAVEPRTAGGTT